MPAFFMSALRAEQRCAARILFSAPAWRFFFSANRASLPIVVGTFLIVAGITLISWQSETQRASFRWWHIGYPLGAAFLAGISHPLRRYALSLANEPLYLAAIIGIVALPWLASYLLLPSKREQPVWDRRCIVPFLAAGVFETLGILLVIIALSVGQVVLVSPIVATGPMWMLLGTWLFLRGIEQIDLAHSAWRSVCRCGNHRDLGGAVAERRAQFKTFQQFKSVQTVQIQMSLLYSLSFGKSPIPCG